MCVCLCMDLSIKCVLLSATSRLRLPTHMHGGTHMRGIERACMRVCVCVCVCVYVCVRVLRLSEDEMKHCVPAQVRPERFWVDLV